MHCLGKVLCARPSLLMMRCVVLLLAHADALRLGSTSAPTARVETPASVIRVYDTKTRSTAVLVGTMHYNPRSIDIARDIVEREAASGALRAVAVESCPTRWNATQESQPRGSLMRFLCDNEMQAGAEAGEDAGVAVVLADQTIEDTGRRLAQLFALTLVELCTPWNGGWSRIYDDLSQAVHMGGEARRSLCVYRCPSCQVTALTSELPPLAGWVKSNTSTPNAGRSVRHASDCQVGALLELFEDILGPDAVQAVGQACRAKWAECVEQLCAVVGRI